MRALLDRVGAGETLCGDGAWGTQLMARGLAPGDGFEIFNATRPDLLAEIASSYLEAGAELVTTNTFGGSPLALATHGLDDRTEELNLAAVEAIRGAVAGRALISGSVGPTGRLLLPHGDTPPEIVLDGFRRQIAALVAAGADLVCIETMMDLEEARLAVRAAREVAAPVPVIATMTFDPTPRGFFTAMGVTVEQACRGLEEAGADLVGANCGHGIEAMVALAAVFAEHAHTPIVIQANAGLPEQRDGALHYPEDPAFMAARVPALLDLGVAVIGGCCGTGPEHIRAIRAAIDARRRRLS
ncbi:MAG: homocysteine S-methyltransferase family protein [Thermoanaerobaculales bacterium]|jgi:5-methyltetrahydrofolate--homocysteine methyltransferase|nr:homocysteine S-methyltransferase family protein [Thermoanaerobaculales bacterium]